MATEHTPLLDSLSADHDKKKVSKLSSSVKDLGASTSTEYRRRPVKRRVTVEPVVLIVIFTNCAVFVTTQYVYNRIAQDLNYTSYSVEQGSTCDENTTDEEAEQQEAVQSAATFYVMINLAVHILPVIFVGVLVGPYTDKAGRKYGMIPQMCFLTLQLILNIIIVATGLPLYCFFIASFIGGLAGGEACITMTGFAYLADITSSEERTMRIYLLQAVLMLGGTVTLIGLSFLIITIGFLNTYLCFLGLYIPVILYAIFLLPEPVIASSKPKLFSISHLRGALKLYARKTNPPRTVKLIILVVITVIAQATFLGVGQTATLYFYNKPFCWNVVSLNVFLAVSMMSMALGGFTFISLTAKCLKEDSQILLGSMFGILHFIAYGLANDTLTAYLAIVFGMFSGFVGPMGRAAATKLVEPDEQGKLQATINPLEQTAQFLATWITNTLYALSLTTLKGLQYFVLAGYMLIILILAIIMHALRYRGKEKKSVVISEKDVVNQLDREDRENGDILQAGLFSDKEKNVMNLLDSKEQGNGDIFSDKHHQLSSENS